MIKRILLPVFLLLITDSGFVNYAPTYGYYVSLFGIIAVGFACAMKIFLRVGKTKRCTRSFLVVVFLLVWLLPYSVLQGAGLGPTLKYLFIIIIAYYIATRYEFSDIILNIVKILFVFAVAALLMWIIVFVFPSTYDKLPKLLFYANNSSGTIVQYRTIGLANMYLSDYTMLPRIYSLFWEPGVCQAYFNIAIIMTMKFIQGKKKVLFISVFALAVILTLSTTGYIVLAAIALYALLFKNKKGTSGNKSIRNLKLVILFALVIVMANLPTLVTTDLYASVFGKLEEGATHGSVASRVGSIVGNLEVFKDHFLLGTGLNKSSAALREYGYFINQTNTIFDCLATFGVLIGAIFVVCWIKFVKAISASVPEFITLIIAWLLILSGESFIQSQFFYVLLMYGLIYWLDNKIVK